MFTESYVFTREVAGRERRIEADADLLNCWWSASEGPQTAEGVVQKHLAVIDAMIADQIAEGIADQDIGEPIVLTVLEYETELGDEFPLTGPLH